MTLATLALVIAVGLAGPLLATPRSLRVPIVVGELLTGVLVGNTGTRWIHPQDPTLSFLASAGFALVMLAAGSHVPIRDQALRLALRKGALIAAAIGVVSVPLGYLVAKGAGTSHGLMYAVIMASSSAALIMPVIDETHSTSAATIATIVQIAIADSSCIVLLPLAEEPKRAGHAALGALGVIAAAGAIFLVVWQLDKRGLIDRLHEFSKQRRFGLELRYNLVIVFGLAGLATHLGVSVMLAGFVSGLMLASIGEPRRLAKQLFALSDGFLAPVFFVWLGASLDLRALGSHPKMILLAGLLSVGTLVAHGSARLLGQPLPFALLSGAQLGVPVAATTIGTKAGLLAPGEGGAMLAAALISVAVTDLAARAISGASPAGAPATPPTQAA